MIGDRIHAEFSVLPQNVCGARTSMSELVNSKLRWVASPGHQSHGHANSRFDMQSFLPKTGVRFAVVEHLSREDSSRVKGLLHTEAGTGAMFHFSTLSAQSKGP